MYINDILSNVYLYQSWENLYIIGGNSRTEIISLIYKKGEEEDIANYRPISILNLNYKFTLQSSSTVCKKL